MKKKSSIETGIVTSELLTRIVKRAIRHGKKEVFEKIEELETYKKYKGKSLDVVFIQELDDLKKQMLKE